MNRITAVIAKLQKTGKKAFIPFITAGYPDIKKTAALVQSLDRAGAALIELGMPFSDPLADGPAIQESSFEAIQSGTTPDMVFECIRKIRLWSTIPIILFTYSNLIISKGIDTFMELLTDSGGDGLIIPDVPLEESTPFIHSAHMHHIKMIQLISPLTHPKRMKRIESVSDDFVYCVSITGVTGERSELFKQIQLYLKTVRETLNKPFMVGFGISTPEDAKKIAQLADGIVVGSALISRIKQHKNSDTLSDEIYHFATEIVNGISTI